MRKRLFVLFMVALAFACILPPAAMAKTKTKLSISVTSSYEHYDTDPLIRGTLRTSSGRALKNRVVKLYCGSKYMGKRRTNSKGKVEFRAVLPGTASGTWRLKYGGNSRYRSAKSARKTTRVHLHYADYATYFEGEIGEWGEEITPSGYSMDVYLEEGRTYQILTSDWTSVSVADSSGSVLYESDDFYEWHWVSPDHDDWYTFTFDPYSDDLFVVVW